MAVGVRVRIQDLYADFTIVALSLEILKSVDIVTRKTMKTRIIPQIGDIVEIKTPKGLAYVQYTAKHTAPPVFGELIRVLPGLYDSPPVDFSALAKEKEKYFVFTPITLACRKKWATVVSNEAVPVRAQGVPIMRMANRIGAGGKVGDWYLWDGIDASPAKTPTSVATYQLD